jgi:hypothetical protein
VPADYHPIVVDSDLAGIKVDRGPPKTTGLAPSDTGGQFEQEERREPIALQRH